MPAEVVQPSSNMKHMSDLLEGLNRERFEQENFCDATLEVDTEEFRVHKCIVGKVSSFFRGLFGGQLRESESSSARIVGFSVEIMKSLLQYIYLGSIDINGENILTLLQASDYFDINELKKSCKNYLVESIELSNCIKYYLVAKEEKWLLLKRKAEQIFNSNFSEVTSQPKFASLEKDDLMYFVSRVEQDAAPEVAKQVFNAIMTWVKYSTDQRKAFIPEMLQLVKFKSLLDKDLKNIANQELIKEFTAIANLVEEEIEWRNECLNTKDKEHTPTNTFVVVQDERLFLFDAFTREKSYLPNLPDDVTGACVTSYRDHLYVIGGRQNPRMIRRLRMRQSGATWKVVGSTMVDRVDARAIVDSDTILIAGGSTKDGKVVECFNEVDSEVRQYRMPPMVYHRIAHSWVKYGDEIHCFGGNKRTKIPAEVYASQSWKTRNEETTFGLCVSVLANNEIFVMDNDKDSAQTFMQAFALHHNEWRTRTRCPTVYGSFAAFYAGGKIYAFGCKKDGRRYDRQVTYVLNEYDVLLDSWREVYSGDLEMRESYVAAILC